ncbi:uncharacterized protein M421DRAFT_422252 [Didymella exigua CBS 183.55]|uniref:Uncharacterized protein n=1 Tax=Didymella exigua CBS 183.55 TaxID=1150837 RepID=A0A6A5RIE7_9PLEO|nr:uncharacterized protein M421DRAFT_422252 [Didymella exigua CBS 183.55]KAF1927010.1 hypothetical protein M421DRAFT_422252 [Didymella exigua CBS 183.55]
MAFYPRRRPATIQVFATHAKRQEAGLGAVGPGSEDGPESPDSPGSSASFTRAPSPGDSSDSEDDEPPTPKESVSPSGGQVSPTSAVTSRPSALLSTTAARSSRTVSYISQTSSSTLATSSTSTMSSTSTTSSTSGTSSTLSRTTSSTLRPNSSPSFTLISTTRGIGAVVPQPTEPATTTTVRTSVRVTSTISLVSPTSPATSVSAFTSTQILSSKIARPTRPATTTVSVLLPPPAGFSGVPVGENDAPRRTRPQPTIISKGAEAAAITLSVIGAIALAVGIFLYCKRRRRRRNEKLEAELERDAANYAALQRPETAHITTTHMTQSSDRSDTLFGPGSYSRPETASTHNGSRIPLSQPTPNPFADPPLNKAYDVLAGRPRSTTLTDRGSWIQNPFKDPESERFDPFGELQAKARRERVKQVELARREAELERQFEKKEKMGLGPPERVMDRNGSGVTLNGLGVLDRSGGGAYR